MFSKLDTISGFWQVSLSKESRLFTTFITPQGCFCFNKLPFGITSAPKHFQCCMSETLDNIPGVVCHVDDVLVSGIDQVEHNEHLHAVLQKIWVYKQLDSQRKVPINKFHNNEKLNCCP